MQILFSGAIPCKDPFGIRAVLGVLDTVSGQVLHLTEYDPPEHLRGGQNIQFTGFCRIGTSLFVCSFNEILVYEGWPPPSEPSRRITHRQPGRWAQSTQPGWARVLLALPDEHRA